MAVGAAVRWAAAGGAGMWVIVCVVVSTAPQDPISVPVGEYRPPPAPQQPIGFSHRAHFIVGLECADCHTTAKSEDRATLPPVSTCMECHATERKDSPDILKLANYAARKEAVPWRRVYQLPDYVWFSHRDHMTSGASPSCATCHGEVAGMDVVRKVKDTSMAACIECHKQHKAPNLCNSCHETL